MSKNDIRLELRIGRPTAPVLASYEVVDALIDLEVTQQDRERGGFQMTFSLGREPKNYSDYWLLREGILDTFNRVVITVIVGVKVGVNRPIKKQILMDGIITNHQIAASNKPGESRLTVTGEDIAPGERVNRPDFGCGILSLIFSPNSPELATAMQVTIAAAIELWLGDLIDLNTLDVQSEDSSLYITVQYRVQSTGEEQEATFRTMVP